MNDDLFVFINEENIKNEEIHTPKYSYWGSVARVFFSKKINIIILTLLILVILFSFIYPIFNEYDAYENILDSAKNLSPMEAIDYYGFDIKWIFGTGKSGQSIFNNVWHGAKTSLSLAFICAFINISIGVIIGAIWGFSKRVDKIMIEVYNVIGNIPYILFISVFVLVVGSGFWSFIAALTITGWLSIAYFIRTQVIIIRDREYNLASKCLGTKTFRLIIKNILPFLTSIIVTVAATEIPLYISYEVFLSFIGIGLSANQPSLGRMIQDAQGSFQVFPHTFWAPVIVSAIVTIILYMAGQNLGDASDPRTHI